MSVYILPYHSWLLHRLSYPPPLCVASIDLITPPPIKDTLAKQHLFSLINSLTAKSVPAGKKLVLFGRYVLNINEGKVQYFLRKTKTWRAKIYLPTQHTNQQISYDIN